MSTGQLDLFAGATTAPAAGVADVELPGLADDRSSWSGRTYVIVRRDDSSQAWRIGGAGYGSGSWVRHGEGRPTTWEGHGGADACLTRSKAFGIVVPIDAVGPWCNDDRPA